MSWGILLQKRGDFLLITLQQLKSALQAVKSYITSVVPTKVSDLSNDSGFGTYTKPSGGIPASDLAEEYVKSTDYATQTNGGIVKIVSNGYYGMVMSGTDNQFLYVNPATSTDVKAGGTPYKPIAPQRQHEAAFYGLAKAAGDTTQSESSNVVGVYTDTAKAKIKEMFGVEKTVTVSGASPTIVAEETVTVLTLPNTVKFPDWFDPTSLEANTVYEINILDGVYGVVMSWPV